MIFCFQMDTDILPWETLDNDCSTVNADETQDLFDLDLAVSILGKQVLPRRRFLIDLNLFFFVSQFDRTSTDATDKDEKKQLRCIVCGAKASGHNFDRITCESCKGRRSTREDRLLSRFFSAAFFRRNALRNLVKDSSLAVCRGKKDLSAFLERIPMPFWWIMSNHCSKSTTLHLLSHQEVFQRR